MFVKLWMCTDIVTIGPEQKIAGAERLFEEHKIRRLPVVQDGNVVGILSKNDIKRAMPSMLDSGGKEEMEFIAETTEVNIVMTSTPITITPEDPLIEAVRKMRKNKIDGLPVVGADGLVGIISISDVLDAFLEIMTTEGVGTRFDLKIDHKPESFYKMIKVFQKQHKEILAIFQHHGYSKDNQLITIQSSGDDNDNLIDMLWDSNVKVDRITPVS